MICPDYFHCKNCQACCNLKEITEGLCENCYIKKEKKERLFIGLILIGFSLIGVAVAIFVYHYFPN